MAKASISKLVLMGASELTRGLASAFRSFDSDVSLSCGVLLSGIEFDKSVILGYQKDSFEYY